MTVNMQCTAALEARVESAVALLRQARLSHLGLLSLELSVEELYVRARLDPDPLRRMGALLAPHASALPALAAWQYLSQLEYVSEDERVCADEALQRILPAASAWTRLVVGIEACRLDWRRAGPALAWQRLKLLDSAALFEKLTPLDELQKRSPLLITSVCTVLDLSGINGDWQFQRAVAESAVGIWSSGSASRARVELTLADTALLRGNYAQALSQARGVLETARGDVRQFALSVESRALGLLRQAEFVALEPVTIAEPPDQGADPEWALPTAFTPEPGRESPLPSLLREEKAATDKGNPQRRVRALLQLVENVERALAASEASADPQLSSQLRLLWCRGIVDLAQWESFEDCRALLDDAVSESHRMEHRANELLALEQRAVLASRLVPEDSERTLLDCTDAARLALELLNVNSAGASDDARLQRALLERYLPAFDRVLEVHVRRAKRGDHSYGRLPSFGAARNQNDPSEANSPLGRWFRFGRLLQGYAEREQTLALDEAQRFNAQQEFVASHLVVAPDQGSPLVLDWLRAHLRAGEVVVQYFFVGPHLLVFALGTSFFEWWEQTIEEDSSAERSVEVLLRAARGWINSGEAADAGVTRLHQLVLPPRLRDIIRDPRVKHLRIVPHGALYRFPFGRLLANAISVARRPTMSIHMTARTAATARTAGGNVRARVGYLVGPELAEVGPPEANAAGSPAGPLGCAAREEQAIRIGWGRLLRGAAIVRMNTSDSPHLLERLSEFSILHFTCHGKEGGAFGQRAQLSLRDGEPGLDTRQIQRLDLRACSLIFLQSCSTGWMDHTRANPVQGIPQAFLDAGALAVIAPLTKVPTALAAVFSEVFYRGLRFLPAETALSNALEVIRRFGYILVADDATAQECLAAHGGTMDAFDYRFVGVTGLVFGTLLSRLVGRFSFYWFRLKLRVSSKIGA